MKAGWEVKALGEVCETVSTGPFGSLLSKKDYVSSGVPLVNPIDIVEGAISSSSVKRVSEDTAHRLSNYRMQSGDIVVARRGELGRCALVNDENHNWLCGTGSFFIRPSANILANYLEEYIRSPMAQTVFEAASTGATMPNISNKTLAKLPIPLPPLEEQKRIVAVLDAAFVGLTRARTHVETNLQNARELFEGYLVGLFLDQSEASAHYKLSSLCERVTVGFVGPMAHRYEPTGVPFLRSQNVRAFELNLENVKFIGKDFNHEIRKSKLKPGDVAIVRTGYPGTAAVIPDTLPVSNCADLVIATPGPKLSAHFLAMFLNSEFGKRMVAEKSVGAAQKHFNVGAAKNVDFPTPPLEEQLRLVQIAADRRNDCLEIEAHYRAKLQDLDDLRQSLLARAFAGELT